MVNVTERAKEVLLQQKVSHDIHDAAIGLRLATTADGRFTLVADRAKAGDEVVTHKDSTVLVVDPQVSALALAGRTVDCRESDDGRLELVVTRSPEGTPDPPEPREER